MSSHRIGQLAALLLLTSGLLRGELPPAAQSALRKGVLAGQQQDYPLALRYFTEAHEAAPGATEIYFNLGLTESKIPGRELRAMAWFGAYLAANPSAPNAAAVREQIDVLEVKQQGNTARLLRLAEEAAGKLSEEPGNFYGKWQKLEYVAWLQAETGDIAGAQRIAGLLKDHPALRQSVFASILRVQAKRGDQAGARKTLAAVRFEDADRYALSAMADAQRKLGDATGALKTLALAARKIGQMSSAEEGAGLQSPWAVRGDAHERMVEQQIEAGDPAGAERTLKQLESNKRSDGYRSHCSALIALGYARVGERAKAEKYIAATQSLVSSFFTGKEDLERDYWWSYEKLTHIRPNLAEAQAHIGQPAASAATLVEARKLTERIKETDRRYWPLLQIAKAQLGIGDTAGGMETIRSVQTLSDAAVDAKVKRSIRAAIAHTLAQGKQAPASAVTPADWLDSLEDNDLDYGSCALASAPFLDLAAYLNSVPTDTAERAFDGIYKAAEQFVRAQTTVLERLKPPAEPPAR